MRRSKPSQNRPPARMPVVPAAAGVYPYLRGELKLELSDANGFVSPGREDIAGFLDGYLTLDRSWLTDWLGGYVGRAFGAPPWYSIALDEIFYDENGFPVLRCRIQLLRGLAWTHVEVQFGIAETGALLLSLRRHRLPAAMLLDGMQALLSQLVEHKINRDISYLKLGLSLERHGSYLSVMPHLREIVIPIRKRNYLQFRNLEDIRCVVRRDAQRNLQLVFDQVSFVTSSDPQGQRGMHWEQGDSLALDMALQAMPDGRVSFSAQGALELNLNEEETRRIQAGGHSLGDVVERLHLHIDINSEVEIGSDRRVHIQSHNTWRFNDLRILGKSYQIKPTDLQISFDPHRGLQFELQPDRPPVGSYEPALSENALRLIVDGPAYLEAMLAAIAGARRWIDLETFLYFPGHTTRRITRALALRAAGLHEPHQGQLEVDPATPQGIPVYVLFSNLELIPEMSEPILAMFRAEIARIEAGITELSLSPRQQRQIAARLRRQLKYHSYVEGIARADHRKLLLIDGHTAFVGGINLGDKFLAPDSFHDVMIEFTGPAVVKAQLAFMENWWRVTRDNGHPEPLTAHALQRKARRAAERWRLPLSKADIILTDARQTETAWAIRHLIEHAKKRIWLEHAYFHHPETLRCLKRALDRGVEILIIVPEVSNIEIFNPTNSECIRQLMAHQRETGHGQVEAYLYTGFPGIFSGMSHTKAMAVDGRYAVIGSANLTLRSLQSPFTEVLTGGSHEHILFNQEIGLYIDDAAFVQRVERALFKEDIAHRCRKLDEAAVKARLAELGGARALAAAEIQARLA